MLFRLRSSQRGSWHNTNYLVPRSRSPWPIRCVLFATLRSASAMGISKHTHGGPSEKSSVEAAQIEPRHQRTQIPPAGPHANTAGGPSLSRLAPNQAKKSGPWGSAFDWCVLDSHHTTQAWGIQGDTALALDIRGIRDSAWSLW